MYCMYAEGASREGAFEGGWAGWAAGCRASPHTRESPVRSRSYEKWKAGRFGTATDVFMFVPGCTRPSGVEG